MPPAKRITPNGAVRQSLYCEALYFGVPSLIMPYCWDGHDNGLRAEQTGTGLNLKRDSWSANKLRETIVFLLSDTEMASRMRTISGVMKRSNGTCDAAQEILRRVKV